MMRLLPLLLLAICAVGCKPPAAPADARPVTEAGDDAAPGIARISAKAAAEAGITLAKAGPASIAETLSLYGVVKPNAERTREVIARFPGTVRTVTKAIGDAVKQGETLATVESNESLQTYAITAPIAGIVTAREADPGEQTGGDVLFTISDAATVWIELSLFPADAARVHIGQNVVVESVGGELKANGRIGLIGVYGSSANQTLTARVLLANEQRHWTPGLFVNGAVELSKAAVPIAISTTAVQRLDGRNVVFVPVDGGFAPRMVKLGRADAERIEVQDGLEAGEAYVALNSFIVKAELGKAGIADEEGGAGSGDEDKPKPASAPR